ncbi:MAG TPA: hypothetical protein P5175_11680 [Anaerohalosphaeraceae bacterium]|nr:hypothetical protein [Anaerohalosphaeraceae bacterium]HRS72493.1 hypothetical protein [Anaerohalosphaeraceae bacterium]
MNNSTNQFGGNDKYYLGAYADKQRTNQGAYKEHEIVYTLLQKVDYQIKERVERIYRQWNTVIRNHIRDETRLKLSGGEAYQAIPVKIVDGLPKLFCLRRKWTKPFNLAGQADAGSAGEQPARDNRPGRRNNVGVEYASTLPIFTLFLTPLCLKKLPAEGRFYLLCVKGVCPFQAEPIQ